MRSTCALLAGLAGLLLAASAAAGELEVIVRGHDGKPVADAVVYLLPAPGTALPAPGRHSIMDQLDRAFRPHVLAVQTGTVVEFPNSDPINHHVYSFSPAKTFQLRLFKNDPQLQTVTFDRAGTVAMGCNIHDWMLGYVFVVDSPWFAVTDTSGRARISGLPDSGSLALEFWHPRAQDRTGDPRRYNAGPGTQMLELNFEKPLKAERRVRQGSYD